MKKTNVWKHGLVLFFLWGFYLPHSYAQFAPPPPTEDMESDLDTGDIFADFNEDVEDTQVLEDERYYRYGRFFSVNVGIGLTTFTGNRGAAYKNDIPSYHLSVTYFLNFRTAFTLGLEYSRHSFNIDTLVNNYNSEILGTVTVNMLRTFFGVRYYIDTANLGTAITFANPYLAGRIEYWYQTNKFTDRQSTIPTEKGGGMGVGLGFGLEFPIVLKKSYIGIETLYHMVNYFDKDTRNYQQIPNNPNSTYGYDDLHGNVWSSMLTYNMSW